MNGLYGCQESIAPHGTNAFPCDDGVESWLMPSTRAAMPPSNEQSPPVEAHQTGTARRRDPVCASCVLENEVVNNVLASVLLCAIYMCVGGAKSPTTACRAG